MAEFPALPLWTDAYIADTPDLTTAEHGCYLLMLMIAWRRPDCALPDDMPWLKRSIAGCAAGFHGHTFNAIVPGLLKRFFRLEGGQWTQKRLSKERAYLKARSAKQRQNALKRSSKRAQTVGKRGVEFNQTNELSDATAMPPHPHPHPHLRDSISKTVLKGLTDFSDPVNRNAYADNKVAEVLGWEVVFAARDPSADGHAKAREAALRVSRSLSVRWEAH
jgi:uncharacterized protein YdaU (DUF1376 family)